MRKTLQYLEYAGIGFGIVVLVLVVWGLLEPRFLDRESIEGEIPELPSGWRGTTVVQLSDWQVGLWLDNPGTVEEAIEETIELDPDLVVLTGDYVYGPEDDPGEDFGFLTRMARKLREAEIPTYGVLGNHDYRLTKLDDPVAPDRARRVRQALQEGGVEMLQNKAVALEAPETAGPDTPPLYVVGVGSRSADRARPARALADVPDGAPRFAIMHHPDTFARFPPHTAPVALAGHTHGGQIRIPGFPEWSWIMMGKTDRVHADGWIPDYGKAGNNLYVNRGIGMSVIPIRINCPPEMTVMTLAAGTGAER